VTRDLHQRALDVLAKLSVVAEGTTTKMDADSGHGAPDSRPPVNVERIAAGRSAISPFADLHGHWRQRFESAWDRPDRLYYFVLLAEEALACAHHPGQRGVREPTESEILAFRGSLPELAARFGVTMAYGQTVRLRNRQDPVTGEEWLWPDREKRDRLTSEAFERAKEQALERARAMLAGGASQRRACEATGIPRGTLQRVTASGTVEPCAEVRHPSDLASRKGKPTAGDGSGLENRRASPP
jgi:hypothetical protein